MKTHAYVDRKTKIAVDVGIAHTTVEGHLHQSNKKFSESEMF